MDFGEKVRKYGFVQAVLWDEDELNEDFFNALSYDQCLAISWASSRNSRANQLAIKRMCVLAHSFDEWYRIWTLCVPYSKVIFNIRGILSEREPTPLSHAHFEELALKGMSQKS
jgi:hypothetical protein